MTPTDYRSLLHLARRHSRHADEAEDLVQEALLAAVAAGRDVAAPANRAWLAGTIRNRAAFAARTAVRRRQRDTAWQTDSSPDAATAPAEGMARLLEGLPPSTKSVAALAFSGHSRFEIRYLLQISDTALRQRLTALKRELRARGVDLPPTTPGLSLDLDYGLIRDSLFGKLVREGGLFASHDPDGHLFVVRRSQNGPARQLTDANPTRSTS